MAIVTAGARLRAASAAFSAIFRTRREELFARPLTAAVRLEDRPALAHAIEAVASGDWPSCAIEVAITPRAGGQVQLRLELEPERQQRVRILATDLTAERLAARTLAEQEENLRALTALSIDIWALVDTAGRVRVVSDSVTVHLGWGPTEVRDRTFGEFLHRDDVDRVIATFQEVAREPTAVRTLVARARHKDGGWRELETTISGYNPRLLGTTLFVVNARDVTARKRTEAALREVESRYAELIGQTLSGIVVVQGGRLVYANARFLELTGLTPEAVARQPRALSLVSPASRAAFRRLRDDLAQGSGPASRIVVEALHADGPTIPVEIATGVVEFEGRTALLCTVTDLSEARALAARAALAEKHEAVALLAGGVAHDFNNLLMAILSWTDIAAESTDPQSEGSVALHEIRSAAERAGELVHQLLAYGRRQMLAPAPLDLGETVVRLKRWMDRVLGPSHRLEVAVPDAPWLVLADRGQVDWALTALMTHAREAMPKGGTIRVRLEHETLTPERAAELVPLRAGDHVVVSISDTGRGLDEDERRRIFDPFYSSAAARDPRVGTGIGLAAVLGTVVQSGGMIDVSSDPGSGTTFRCYFPRHA